MKPKKKKDVSRSLIKKGFRIANSGDEMYYLFVDGKKTGIRTMMSHGEREIHPGLLAAMARDVRLPAADFERLIECPLSAEEYLQILIENGDYKPPASTGKADINAEVPGGRQTMPPQRGPARTHGSSRHPLS